MGKQFMKQLGTQDLLVLTLRLDMMAIQLL